MARQTSKLNALKVQSLKTPGFYSDGAGLYLRVSRSGAKSWAFRFKQNKRAREMGLGAYPLRSLAEARDRALQARKLLLDGQDPIDSRMAAKRKLAREYAKTITFDECVSAYIERHKPGWSNAKHAAQWDTTLTSYVSPVFGKLSVRDIDTGLVMKALEPIWERVPETAVRVRNRIEKVLDWATVREYREGENPARWKGHLENLLPKTSKIKRVKHFAALPFIEIPGFMRALTSQPKTASMALEFTILTAARSGEVRGARWEEIDFPSKTWTIPATRMKAKREHRVPLSSRALDLLHRVNRQKDMKGLIFKGRNADSPLSDMALTAVLRRMKCEVTAHGFRSTFRDWAGERTSFPSEIAEAALAHVNKNKVEAAYRRGDFFEKRSNLMEAWATYCSQSANEGGVVVGINSQQRTLASL